MSTPKIQKSDIFSRWQNPGINVQNNSGHLMLGRSLLGR